MKLKEVPQLHTLSLSLNNQNSTKREAISTHSFTFIDLFAGIGGFHVAAQNLGGTCVYASEIDADAQETYRANFLNGGNNHNHFNLVGDIVNEVENRIHQIPGADFVFAGFPCQPFSKGGFRRGFADTRGTLFFSIAKILDHKKPPFVLLENVANLLSHDDGNTYATIEYSLRSLGYSLSRTPLVLSPDQFGVPVHRPRVYIPAIRSDIAPEDFYLPLETEPLTATAYSLVNPNEDAKDFYVSEYEEKVLNMWDDFYESIDIKVIGFPVWADYFTDDEVAYDLYPKWKAEFIRKNKALYERNKRRIEAWLKKHDFLNWVQPTHRKFEWQAGESIESVWEGLIQFRPSGVRVKRPDRFSTLVAMNHPQIVGPYKRRLTPHEAKRLQSFPDTFVMHEKTSVALKQLGNAVNVRVVERVIRAMWDVATNQDH